MKKNNRPIKPNSDDYKGLRLATTNYLNDKKAYYNELEKYCDELERKCEELDQELSIADFTLNTWKANSNYFEGIMNLYRKALIKACKQVEYFNKAIFECHIRGVANKKYSYREWLERFLKDEE